MLGAVPDSEFDPAPEHLRFVPGDTLIAYTDGATQVRNLTGSMLGFEGLQRRVAMAVPDEAPEGGWASAILRSVAEFRSGPSSDDILIVEIYTPLDAG